MDKTKEIKDKRDKKEMRISKLSTGGLETVLEKMKEVTRGDGIIDWLLEDSEVEIPSDMPSETKAYYPNYHFISDPIGFIFKWIEAKKK